MFLLFEESTARWDITIGVKCKGEIRWPDTYNCTRVAAFRWWCGLKPRAHVNDAYHHLYKGSKPYGYRKLRKQAIRSEMVRQHGMLR
jgi:hypothetical protein